jgi:hypothetical protein
VHRSLRDTELAARGDWVAANVAWVPVSGVQALIPKPTKGYNAMTRAARELLRAVDRNGTDLPRKPDKHFVVAFIEKNRIESRQRLDRALPWRQRRVDLMTAAC